MKDFLYKNRGVSILVMLALMYLVPYNFIIQKSENSVTEIYYADRITEAHRILIERYNRINAGSIRVVPIDFPNIDFSTNERKEVLARSLRGEGDGIDLFGVDVIGVQRFAKWAEPLGKYFTEEELSRFSSTPLSSGFSEGKLVAVPLVMVQGMLFYREDLIRKSAEGEKILQRLQSPITWDEFILMQKALGSPQPYYIFPAADYEGLICVYMEILLSIKPDYFSTIGFDFNTPEAAKALQFLTDLIHKYKITPDDVTGFTEVASFQNFIDRDAIFIHGWTSYEKDFQTPYYNKEKQQYIKKALIPYVTGGKPSSTIGGWDLMISKFSTKKEAAIDFIKYLVKEESQEMFYSHSGYFPVLRSFSNDSTYLKRYPGLQFMNVTMKAGIHRPPHKDYTRYSKIMSYYFNLALKGKIPVSEALQTATASIQSEKVQIDTR